MVHLAQHAAAGCQNRSHGMRDAVEAFSVIHVAHSARDGAGCTARRRSREDAESRLRTEWERGDREGNPSAWDEIQAALHHGWDQAKT